MKRSIKDIRKTARRLVLAAARRLPVSSQHIGLPRGEYACSSSYAQRPAARRAGVRCLPFKPAGRTYRRPPRTVDEPVPWKFDGRCEQPEPETFTLVIPRGRTAGSDGAVISPDDRILMDVSRDFSGTNRLLKRISLPRCRRLPGRTAVLATPGGGALFHWMTDALPRLAILEHTLPGGLDSIDHFVVNRGIPAVVESLTAAGISPQRMITADEHTHLLADELAVPSRPGISGNPPRWACDFLRKQFLPSVTKKTSHARIYISRSGARYRRVVNEAELFAPLAEHGFHTVRLESLSLAEQIDLFASAECVVAPHGAGLTNLLWCCPGTRVLELFSPNYVNVCFWALANQLGLDYTCLTGTGEPPPKGRDPHLVRDDIHVPTDRFRHGLEILNTGDAP